MPPEDFANESRAATFMHTKTTDPPEKNFQPEEKSRQTHTKNMSYYSRRDYILSGGTIEPVGEQDPQAEEEQKAEDDDENIDEDHEEAGISEPKVAKTELNKVHDELQQQEDEKEEASPKLK